MDGTGLGGSLLLQELSGRRLNMQRAFSFPVTVERSRTKERLEASLAGLCELELRKQRQECLVLGALALGEQPAPEGSSRGGELACFSSWGQENLTLRRQLSALQSSPWGLMQTLEQQVGELRVDAENDGGACDAAPADAGDSRPSSGFFEPSEVPPPRGRSESTETSPVWAASSDRPKSVGELLNGEPVLHGTLPRSFSAPYPPLEGIAEEGAPTDPWQWEAWQQQQQLQQEQQQQQQQPPAELQLSEEDYQQVVRVEGYILSLIQRHTLAPRPSQPRTTLHPEPTAYACPAPPGHGPAHRRTPSLSAEQRATEPLVLPQLDLPPNPQTLGWGRDLLEGGATPRPLEEDCYLALAYAPPRPHSLTERLTSPLPSLEAHQQPPPPSLPPPPSSSSSSSQHYFLPLPPPPPPHSKNSLVSAQYVPVQGCHAPVRSPRHYNPEQPKHGRTPASPEHPASKSRSSKKNHSHERQRAKRSGGAAGGGGGKAGRSQSENSLLGQRVLPERRYSTTERHQGRADPSQNQGPAAGQHPGHGEGRRWCSNLELSQDEGEAPASHAHRRPHRKARHAHSCSQNQTQNYYQHHHHHHHHHHQNHHHQHQQQQQQQHSQRRHPDYQLRAPLCQEEEGYGGGGGAAPAESESSMSEVYSPASSSLSSDSDESGGLVWPQQLPPRLVSTSSSSSPSPQTASAASSSSASATAGAATAQNQAQPKAFVKIKASHALKKKILRFRSGSLKVMTTV